MSTYRVGNHWGVTIVREGYTDRNPATESYVIRPDELVAVVVNGDQALAERICALLNRAEAGPRTVAVNLVASMPVDSCTCPRPSGPSTMPDPLCVVHRGRRARGPKPPPIGEGCICDGSGRTCPRHGAVM